MEMIIDEPLPEGLVLVAASGIGEQLSIPEQWDDAQVYAKSNNALFLDHRGLAGDIYSRLKLQVAGEAPKDATKLLQTTLEVPTRRLYIGDHEKRYFKIIDTAVESIELQVFGSGNGDAYNLTIVV